MPLSIPTLAELREQTRSQLIAQITGANPALRRMLIKVIADVLAGSLWLLYRFLVWLSEQLFLDSSETTYLERQASIDGINRKAAAPAAGNVTFSGAPDGVPVPIGLLLSNADQTAQYSTQAAGVIAGGVLTLAILQTTGSEAGNLPAGAPVTLLVAVAGVQPTALVAVGGLTGGLDIESDASLRSRALDNRRLPPQGGDANDYVQWARAVPGVTRAWCFPLRRGPGTADVAFVMDGRADIIPLPGDVATVQAAIDAVRPVTADSVVFTLIADAIPVTITGLIPNNSLTQQAIIASLTALFATTTPGGATVGSGVAAGVPGGTLWLEQISAAVNNAAGVNGFDLTLPTTDVLSASGHIAKLGTVTFL